MIVFRFLGRLLLLSILILPTGCVRDLDLDQTDNIKLEPKYDLDLFHLNISPDNFVDSNGDTETTEVHQVTHLDFINDKVVQDDLKQIDLDFKTLNSFTQSFQTTFVFLDAAGNATYTIEVEIPGSPNGSPIIYTQKEVLTEEALELFKTSVDLDVTAILTLDSQPIDGTLEFKSKALFYFEF